MGGVFLAVSPVYNGILYLVPTLDPVTNVARLYATAFGIGLLVAVLLLGNTLLFMLASKSVEKDRAAEADESDD